MKKLLLGTVLLGLTFGTFATPSALAGRSESRTSGSMTIRQSSSSESSSGGVYIRPNPTLRQSKDRSRRVDTYVTITNSSTEKDISFTLTTREDGTVEEYLYAGETYDFPIRRAAKITYNPGSLFNKTKTIQAGERWVFKRSWTGDVWLEKE